MKSLRLLLYPFSLVYAAVIALRNAAYDTGLLNSRKFELPVISVGNLAAGGTGKSPMAEYIINLLKDSYKVATLSRGYGRKTTGFVEVSTDSTVNEAGDEPLQFKRKFPSITVAVCENRATGIERLQPLSDVIILDDAFQHRSVHPGLNLLLFDFNSISNPQLLLPAGNLRESLAGRKRADIIIITKTPVIFSRSEEEKVVNKIRPFSGQEIFFSYLEYGELTSFKEDNKMPLASIDGETEIILLTGIANSETLLSELKRYTGAIHHHKYPDHYNFSKKNILKLADAWSSSNAKKKIIITTEKDAQRLRSPGLNELLKGLSVYYLPVAAKIHKPGEQRFNRIIEHYVAEHLQNNGVH